MKLTKYAQSAFLIEEKNKRILIDPGSYCYDENFTANDWGKVDILLITHTHADHCFPEAIKVLKQNNPGLVILSNNQVKQKLAEEGIEVEILEVGEERNIDGIKITGVESVHGDLPSGNPKPDVLGFLIDNKVYHPGDTIYLEEKPRAEVALLPICGTVVMNPAKAAKFAKEMRPKLAIPMHYDNLKYPVDVNDFIREMEGTGIEVKVLKNRESVIV